MILSLHHLEAEITKLDTESARRAKEDDLAKRLMTNPGIGPLIATAFATLVPAAKIFRKGRDFAAWLGLVPWQYSIGVQQRLGTTTKIGERSLRGLLIIGANSVIIKRNVRAVAKPGSWLGEMLGRQPATLARVAPANTMARIVWALMAHGGVYKAPAPAM